MVGPNAPHHCFGPEPPGNWMSHGIGPGKTSSEFCYVFQENHPWRSPFRRKQNWWERPTATKGLSFAARGDLVKGQPTCTHLTRHLELAGRELYLEECQAAVVQDFQRDTGWELVEVSWEREEQELLMGLVVEKYSH